MLKTTLIAALAALSLGTAIAATASPASAGCEHSYSNAYETPAYGYDHSQDPSYGEGNRYGYRRSGENDGNRYGHRRSYNDGGYDNGGY